MPLLVVRYDLQTSGPYRVLKQMANDYKPAGLLPLAARVMRLAGRSPAPEDVEYDPNPYSTDAQNVPALKVVLDTSAEPRDASGKTPWDHRNPMLVLLAEGISTPMRYKAAGVIRVVLDTGDSNADIQFNAFTGEILSVWNLSAELKGYGLGTS